VFSPEVILNSVIPKTFGFLHVFFLFAGETQMKIKGIKPEEILFFFLRLSGEPHSIYLVTKYVILH